MKTTQTTIVALAVLGALALPAAAGHDAPVRRDVRVASIAHQVEAQARRVHRLAERHAHHGTFLEEKALGRLHALEDQARDFHRRVERGPRRDRRTRAEFHALMRAFYRAENGLHWMHAYDVIDGEFERLATLVERLETKYDGRAYGWSSRRWRRYGSLTVPFLGPKPRQRLGRG